MTGILVALLIIVTAALCFLLGMIVGVAAVRASEEEKRKRFEQTMTKAANSDLQDWEENK